MPNYTTDPNMGFLNPTVGVETGPAYATEVGDALTTIGAHDHSSGKGIQITPAGININTDLTFNTSYNATNLRSVRMANQTAPLAGVSDISCLYTNVNELWFNSGTGLQTQITDGGILNVGSLGNLVEAYQAVSSNRVIINTDTYVLLSVDTSADRTITLPAANGVTAGRRYRIVDATGSAATHNITVARAGSDTINGATSFLVVDAYGSVELESDGVSAWSAQRGLNNLLTLSGLTSTSGTITTFISTGATITTLTTPTITTASGALTLQTGGTTQLSLAAAALTWDKAVASPLIGQTAQSTDALPTDLKLQSQYAYASATGSNRTPGAIILDVGAPTNSSTTENQVKFTRNGSLIAQIGIGGAGGSTLNTRMWLGSNGGSYTASNYVLLSDNNTGVTLNAPSVNGVVSLITNNSTSSGLNIMASDGYFGGTSNTAPIIMEWVTTASPVMRSGTNATSLAIGTNKASAVLKLNGGTGSDGAVQIMTTRIAASGGASIPTLGAAAIGVTSGPATQAQDGWIPIKDSAGNLCWIPVWR